MVTINGKKYDFSNITIYRVLEKLNYNIERVVVEKNENIVPKANYDEVSIQDGDVLEVISFVGGG
ncbi:sulfur carrier protein ThiS [Lachnobacterium bovis]|uniref:Sulfur carrier protein n=1 Tax=Lachnobacterium bovis DSM 14045 TaxID=1122142 RepID=A0A1H3IXX2_9FIRM|nr:sulfur carrier protein ThiS [Lachnobacterium bovis]SDY32165.1 sulfur carrier protein [Lachnobacterium bovis DSM 14045]